jgi:large subunit ribosomal protein L9
MQVYLLKDVENVGMAGQVIKVSDGYASNFLIPRKIAVKVTNENLSFYKNKVQKIEVEKKVLSSKTAMLAEKIKDLHIVVKKRAHDEGKLYGAIGADDVVEILKEKGIIVNKKQIEFPKAVRAIGEHKVTIKLSSKLKPEFTLKVVAQEQES